MSMIRKVIILYSPQDDLGRYHYAILRLVTGGCRTEGIVVQGQHFFDIPPRWDNDPEVKFFREWEEKEARTWLTEGIQLTPTCKYCGIGEDRHIAPHPFLEG